MKKVICMIVAALFALSMVALAEFDLSGMTLDELIELQEKVTAAMWASDEWQEVEVPAGIYEVGVDIPAGYWTISPVDGGSIYVGWSDKLKESGASVSFKEANIFESERLTSPSYKYRNDNIVESVSWNLQEGTYIEIGDSSAVFTPFAGHNLGFKK